LVFAWRPAEVNELEAKDVAGRSRSPAEVNAHPADPLQLAEPNLQFVAARVRFPQLDEGTGGGLDPQDFGLGIVVQAIRDRRGP
jgi:hypothetical protein